MASMSHWLKSSPDDAALVDGARGEKRKMYLAAFFGVVMKDKEMWDARIPADAHARLPHTNSISTAIFIQPHDYWPYISPSVVMLDKKNVLQTGARC